ncbi:unnamed protein product [Amoebophrya sp. A120]|nr:unnamed protein product [Amoebophrya sp. A120]|eukprot:GSA120T00018804001.1
MMDQYSTMMPMSLPGQEENGSSSGDSMQWAVEPLLESPLYSQQGLSLLALLNAPTRSSAEIEPHIAATLQMVSRSVLDKLATRLLVHWKTNHTEERRRIAGQQHVGSQLQSAYLAKEHTTVVDPKLAVANRDSLATSTLNSNTALNAPRLSAAGVRTGPTPTEHLICTPTNMDSGSTPKSESSQTSATAGGAKYGATSGSTSSAVGHAGASSSVVDNLDEEFGLADLTIGAPNIVGGIAFPTTPGGSSNSSPVGFSSAPGVVTDAPAATRSSSSSSSNTTTTGSSTAGAAAPLLKPRATALPRTQDFICEAGVEEEEAGGHDHLLPAPPEYTLAPYEGRGLTASGGVIASTSSNAVIPAREHDDPPTTSSPAHENHSDSLPGSHEEYEKLEVFPASNGGSVDQRLPYEPPSLHEQLMELRRKAALNTSAVKNGRSSSASSSSSSSSSSCSSSSTSRAAGGSRKTATGSQSISSQVGADQVLLMNINMPHTSTYPAEHDHSSAKSSPSAAYANGPLYSEYRVRQLRLGGDAAMVSEGGVPQVSDRPATHDEPSAPQIVDLFPPLDRTDSKKRILTYDEANKVYDRLWHTAVKDVAKKRQLEEERLRREGPPTHRENKTLREVVAGRRASDRLYRDASRRRKRSVSSESMGLQETHSSVLMTAALGGGRSVEKVKGERKKSDLGSSIATTSGGSKLTDSGYQQVVRRPRVQMRTRSRSSSLGRESVAERLYQEGFTFNERRKRMQKEYENALKELSNRAASNIGNKNGSGDHASSTKPTKANSMKQYEGALVSKLVDKVFANVMAQEQKRKRAESLNSQPQPTSSSSEAEVPDEGVKSGAGSKQAESSPADLGTPSSGPDASLEVEEHDHTVRQSESGKKLVQAVRSSSSSKTRRKYAPAGNIFMEDHVLKNFSSPLQLQTLMLKSPPALITIRGKEKLLSAQPLPGGATVFVRDPSRSRSKTRDQDRSGSRVDDKHQNGVVLTTTSSAVSSATIISAGSDENATSFSTGGKMNNQQMLKLQHPPEQENSYSTSTDRITAKNTAANAATRPRSVSEDAGLADKNYHAASGNSITGYKGAKQEHIVNSSRHASTGRATQYASTTMNSTPPNATQFGIGSTTSLTSSVFFASPVRSLKSNSSPYGMIAGLVAQNGGGTITNSGSKKPAITSMTSGSPMKPMYNPPPRPHYSQLPRPIDNQTAGGGSSFTIGPTTSGNTSGSLPTSLAAQSRPGFRQATTRPSPQKSSNYFMQRVLKT